VVLFTGPYFFVDQPLWPPAVAHLREGASKTADEATSPTGAAIEYLYFGPGIDPPDWRYIQTKVSVLSPTEVIVSVFDGSGDDSVYLTCDRLTMRLEDNIWIPIRHQEAWQGRGRIGWTTKPCL
jgi:hypothetical protein